MSFFGLIWYYLIKQAVVFVVVVVQGGETVKFSVEEVGMRFCSIYIVVSRSVAQIS